jgi:hypothetical protein
MKRRAEGKPRKRKTKRAKTPFSFVQCCFPSVQWEKADEVGVPSTLPVDLFKVLALACDVKTLGTLAISSLFCLFVACLPVDVLFLHLSNLSSTLTRVPWLNRLPPPLSSVNALGQVTWKGYGAGCGRAGEDYAFNKIEGSGWMELAEVPNPELEKEDQEDHEGVYYFIRGGDPRTWLV